MNTIIQLPSGFDVAVLVTEFCVYSLPFVGLGFVIGGALLIINTLRNI